MTTEHTPGPWFWNSYDAIWAGKGDDSERIASVSHLEYDDEGDEITSHGDAIFGLRKVEAGANAHLIAAAPALLEALEKLLVKWGNHHPDDRDLARAVIAQAKGE